MFTAIASATYVRHKQIVIDKDNKLRYLATNYTGLTTQLEKSHAEFMIHDL